MRHAAGGPRLRAYRAYQRSHNLRNRLLAPQLSHHFINMAEKITTEHQVSGADAARIQAAHVSISWARLT